MKEVTQLKTKIEETRRTLENAVLKLIDNPEIINENEANNETEINKLKAEIQELKEKLERSSNRRPKISKDKEDQIIKLRQLGYGMNKIAKLVNCGDGTVRRVLLDNNMN